MPYALPQSRCVRRAAGGGVGRAYSPGRVPSIEIARAAVVLGWACGLEVHGAELRTDGQQWVPFQFLGELQPSASDNPGTFAMRFQERLIAFILRATPRITTPLSSARPSPYPSLQPSARHSARPSPRAAAMKTAWSCRNLCRALWA